MKENVNEKKAHTRQPQFFFFGTQIKKHKSIKSGRQIFTIKFRIVRGSEQHIDGQTNQSQCGMCANARAPTYQPKQITDDGILYAKA